MLFNDALNTFTVTWRQTFGSIWAYTFAAITDIWNVSIYIYIMDKNIGCIPPNKIPYTTIVAFGAVFNLHTHPE